MMKFFSFLVSISMAIPDPLISQADRKLFLLNNARQLNGGDHTKVMVKRDSGETAYRSSNGRMKKQDQDELEQLGNDGIQYFKAITDDLFTLRCFWEILTVSEISSLCDTFFIDMVEGTEE
ncbi:Oidioi.mRNA.OKI2018_I69.XSR.g15586.t1.cds [Oikopleura dioica]|uniref:Oidioi.mRNA.OKI2018_I69.XSR.g15586.t1.cds n=1 Tax=Oikopleura dioica TaxID=34765 RepID=A0ABN7SHC5_OIKDI|nr:Oidioi.mRNA.OKI2018_I69.XSR.g15586.t1.cds [Oikopleura dioica]